MRLRKQHPCGGYLWKVVRLGAGRLGEQDPVVRHLGLGHRGDRGEHDLDLFAGLGVDLLDRVLHLVVRRDLHLPGRGRGGHILCASNAITAAQFAPGAITSVHIASNTFTAAKL